MKTLLAVLFMLWLSTLAEASDRHALEGTWIQEGVKWVSAPPDVNPHAQWAQAAILYFGKEQKFGLIYCTVDRTSGKYMTISPGDPRGVFKGEWKSGDHALSITYQLVEATILQVGEKLPGPMKNGTIKVSKGPVLTFEGKTFRRAPDLAKSAMEAIFGIQAPSH